MTVKMRLTVDLPGGRTFHADAELADEVVIKDEHAIAANIGILAEKIDHDMQEVAESLGAYQLMTRPPSSDIWRQW